jgi:hypothetical protein
LSTSGRSKSIRPAVDLGTGDERAGELGEHEGVQHVARRVQRCHPETTFGVDTQQHVAGRLRVTVEHVPPAVALDLDAGDRGAAAGPLELADVAHLTSAARVERRSREHDRTGTGVDHRRVVDVEVGLLMTEIDGHDHRVENRPRVL